MLSHIIEHFEWFYKKFHPDVPTFEYFEINWLKSLKPQKHWKPSKEQMTVLKNAIHFYGKTVGKEVLESLYNDLKTLKESNYVEKDI